MKCSNCFFFQILVAIYLVFVLLCYIYLRVMLIVLRMIELPFYL